MESIQSVFTQVIILFITIFIGFLARFKNIINEETEKGLAGILINITLPLLIFASFVQGGQEDLLKNGFQLLIFSTIVFILFIIISRFIFRGFQIDKQSILKFSTVYSNCGFMGFPILYSIYGKEGILYAAIFNIPFDILVWTIGVRDFSKESKKKFSHILKDPNIIAVILGIMVLILQIKMPVIILKTSEMIGNTTTPIAMLLIGAMLKDVHLKETFSDFSIMYISILRLLIIPLATYAFLSIFRINDIVREVIIVCQAMPVAALGAIIAKNYDKNPKYASVVVFSSTFFSIFTIPLVIWILYR